MTSDDYQELVDEGGRLGRLFPERQWQVPDEIWLEGDRLVSSRESSHPPPLKRLRELLPEFINLAEAPAETILRFAQKWGVFKLCEHDVPEGHPPYYWPTRPSVAYSSHIKAPGWSSEFPIMMGAFHYCLPQGDEDKGLYWEPVAAWRRWATIARATLSIVAQLRNNRIVPEREWRTAYGLDGKARSRWAPGRPKFAWLELSNYLNYWLKLGSANVMTETLNERLQIVIGKGSTFGAVAVQLVLAACGTEGYVMCSSCKGFYVPTRRPRRDQKNYCTACTEDGVPQKNAAATYRNKRANKSRKSNRDPKKAKRRASCVFR
jgi:hypothetical protein